jgi:hypothetical protein
MDWRICQWQESSELIQSCQDKQQLTQRQLNRSAGRRNIVLIEVDEGGELAPFPIDKRDFGEMDGWLPVGGIEKATLQAHAVASWS